MVGNHGRRAGRGKDVTAEKKRRSLRYHSLCIGRVTFKTLHEMAFGLSPVSLHFFTNASLRFLSFRVTPPDRSSLFRHVGLIRRRGPRGGFPRRGACVYSSSLSLCSRRNPNRLPSGGGGGGCRTLRRLKTPGLSLTHPPHSCYASPMSTNANRARKLSSRTASAKSRECHVVAVAIAIPIARLAFRHFFLRT